ncbi:uncharacterized protein LOC131617411 [Vicia villosa]|uniref:uncharacterized protein LOC131617411 n=1 Tax=Vicia villosa TaxID=3911 RepID=UPI00273AD15B|nr:uncharacterized protein LOC131617411 [Vicia villosa]
MKAPTILKSFLFRPRAPAMVVPLPQKTRFDRKLTAGLGVHGCDMELVQLLDAAVTTQKIVLDSLAKISYSDGYDHGDVDKYLEDNVEFLDVCNYFVEKIENIYNYLDKLKVVVHLVDNNCSPLKPNNVATTRAMELLNSSSCKIVEKRSSNGLKKLLRQKLCHDETEMSEIMCGSKAMTLMCLRFLELGLSFDLKSLMLPKMKILSQPTSSSWLRLLQELTKEAEASVDGKKLQETVDAARELKEQMKREKEMKCCVERLKRRCKELEDVVEVIEERVKDLYKCLIDVRMTLLGILSQH